MIHLVRIITTFAVIVLLLRRKWNLGLVMLIAAAFLGALCAIGPGEQARVLFEACIDEVTVKLLSALLLIMVLENIIRKRGLISMMTASLTRVARDRRISMAVLPGVIGLLPSAGGAQFSAPMVQEAAGDAEIPPERRAFINYWFRHIWEYISPLYPGIVLAAAVTKLELNSLLLSQLPLPLAVVGVGALLAFRGVPAGGGKGLARDWSDVRALVLSTLPITASIAMVVAFNINLALAMALIIIALILFYRYSFREIGVSLRESFSLNIVTMVVGIMVFKGMLDASGAIEALPVFFEQSGLPRGLVLFTLPFLVGLLTGLTVGFVGATFPLVTALFGGHPDPSAITFAFASGFAGVMLSPTHLCLVLTMRYFKADMAGTYRLLYLPTALVFLAGFGVFVIG